MNRQILEDVKIKLQETADILYKDNLDQGIAGMSQVIPHIAIMAAEMNDEELQTRLIKDALRPALDAMERKDATLLADIISYELIKIVDLMLQ